MTSNFTRKFVILSFTAMLLLGLLNATFVYDAKANPDWLSGWSYRKSHVINAATGAGTNYTVNIKAYYNNPNIFPVAPNALAPSISTYYYLAENIVFDSVTTKFWWIYTDRTTTPWSIALAYTTSIDDTWTVQGTIISETGHRLDSPHIVKFGSYWYIYYSRSDGAAANPCDIWVQNSTAVNSGYSGEGISNPILIRGTYPTWDDNRVSECYVILISSTYYIFYMGEDADELLEQTGYATSSSPTSGFSKYASNPILPADGYPHGWDNGQDRAADPFVFFCQGYWYIGVSAVVFDKASTGRIGFYYTTDFVNFYHHSGNPILGYGASGSWDDTVAARGAVSEFNGILYLSYMGYSGVGDYRMGLTKLLVDVNLQGHSRTDFGDVRFTDNDETTLLDSFLESKTDSDNAVFWVEVADSLESSVQTIYIYYGKSDATKTVNDQTDGIATFLFFDTFPGSSIDTDKWGGTTANTAVSNSILDFYATNQIIWLYALTSQAINKAFEFCIKTNLGANKYSEWLCNKQQGTRTDDFMGWDSAGAYGGAYLAGRQTEGAAGQENTITNGHPSYSYTPSGTTYNLYGLAWTSAKVFYQRDYVTGSYLDGEVPNDSLYPTFRVGSNNAGVTAHIYCDWVRVRKYVSPEPMHGAWGSEETPGHSLNLRIMDWDLIDPISGAIVYKDTSTLTSNALGWANWTLVSGTVQVKVKYYEYWVNGTFPVTMDSDKTINVKCKLYDVNVIAKPNNEVGILSGVNVTAYNNTGTSQGKIKSGITSDITGQVTLTNVPNATLRFIIYAKSDFSIIIANTTQLIPSDGYSFNIVANQNYATATSSFGYEAIIWTNSLSFLLLLGIVPIMVRKKLKKRKYGGDKTCMQGKHV